MTPTVTHALCCRMDSIRVVRLLYRTKWKCWRPAVHARVAGCQ